MKKSLLTVLQYVLFLSLGIFLVWWSIHKLDDKNWEACKHSLKSARYILFIPVFFILTASHISRAIRWRLLMKPMGYQPRLINIFFAVMVGYLANLAVPRLGEVIKCTILSKYEKVPPDKLVGTIIIERAVDVISLFIIFVITLVSQAGIIGNLAGNTLSTYFFKGSTLNTVLKISVLLIFLALVYVLMMFIFKRFGHNKLIQRFNAIYKGVLAGLMSIKNMENKWRFIFHSVFIWCCYLLGTYVGFFATRGTENLPLIATFPVLAFASIGMIISPGGIGFYAYFIKQVMVLYGVLEGIAMANGNLQWIAQYMIILVMGFISLLLLPYFNKGEKKTVNPTPSS